MCFFLFFLFFFFDDLLGCVGHSLGCVSLLTFVSLVRSSRCLWCRSTLLCYKHKTHGQVWSNELPAAKGKWVSYSDVDFTVDEDMINIVDTKVQRRYADYFTQAITDLNRGQ